MKFLYEEKADTVGGNIRHLRKVLGLTQKELACLVGLTQAQISDYERGFRVPSLQTLDKLLLFFKGKIR